MQDKLKAEALRESRKALDLMARSVLTAAEQQAVVDDCVTNFDKYVNPGILEYRKSVSSDYTSVEWRDEGSVFYDIHGKEFIDCLGGFGIYMLGHRHPTVVKAVRDQLEHQALHSQELLDPMRGYLSHLLAMVTPGDLRYSFFCNSGTEANEGAMKIAKLYARRKKADHTLGMISTTRGFHGKSFGSLSVSGKGEFREPFYPLMSGVRFVPYGDADALDKQLGICDAVGFDIAAFIVEPVQGEAGAIIPPADYFPKVREICDKWGILLIADEVQTGMGRTGKLWGMDHSGVAPDIMTMGKALGGAVIPIGNFIATEDVFSTMYDNPYIHTTTFGGNPMATAAAIGAMHATLEEDIPGQAAEKGAYLKGKLTEMAGVYDDLFEEIRGVGVIIGMQFKNSDIGYAVSQGLFGRGVLIGGTLFNSLTLRMQPPAIITYEQMDTVLERLEATLADVRKLAAQGRAGRALRRAPSRRRARRRPLRTQRGPGRPQAPRPSSFVTARRRRRPSGAARRRDHQSEKPVLYQGLLGALLGALLPLLGLGLLVDARPHLVGDPDDLGLLLVGQDRDIAHMLFGTIEVRGGGVPETPVVGEAPGDVADIDLLVVVLAEVGDREQVLDVDEVLVVDLPDLQLLQKDIGQRHAPGIGLQTAVVVDFVAVVELVDEDVDHGDRTAEIDVAAVTAQGHGLQVALVPHRLHELREMLARLAIGREVDVGEVAVAEALELGVQVDLLREIVVKRQRAHHAHDDALRLRGLGDALPLGEEHLRLGILVERDVFGQDELTHLSPPFGIGVSSEVCSLRPGHPDVKT